MVMPCTQSPRILIVDDESAQMKALCDTLIDYGYQAVGFTSGMTALAALQETRFDLLFTDLMMPEMSGIALLQAALVKDPSLVCILMTGEGSIATAVEAMKGGALDYILKPFKLSVILPVLSRSLEVRRLRMENLELEQRVRERTTELEAMNKDLDAFSFSVSHELRAPLRAIDGFSKMLLEEYSPQMPTEAQRLLGLVVANTRRMTQLIEDLLDFSRLGRQPLSKRPVNVSAIVHEVLDELRQEQVGRHVEMRLGDLSDAVGDPSLLKQVFVNLLSNAFKFTQRKERALVEVGCTEQKEEKIYFVRDNGVGFDMRYAKRLFGVFQRFHSTEQFKGTGVGLSVVQRIIQRHGGRIWAQAEVDTGATFYFSLPT
jgi:two-component system sensor histidine kinase/response regulator